MVPKDSDDDTPNPLVAKDQDLDDEDSPNPLVAKDHDLDDDEEPVEAKPKPPPLKKVVAAPKV